MILYAGLDGRINGGWQDDTAAREANGNEFGVHFSPIVNHGGHNAMTPRNDGEAAELAWKGPVAFFETHLTRRLLAAFLRKSNARRIGTAFRSH